MDRKFFEPYLNCIILLIYFPTISNSRFTTVPFSIWQSSCYRAYKDDSDLETVLLGVAYRQTDAVHANGAFLHGHIPLPGHLLIKAYSNV